VKNKIAAQPAHRRAELGTTAAEFCEPDETPGWNVLGCCSNHCFER